MCFGLFRCSSSERWFVPSLDPPLEVRRYRGGSLGPECPAVMLGMTGSGLPPSSSAEETFDVMGVVADERFVMSSVELYETVDDTYPDLPSDVGEVATIPKVRLSLARDSGRLRAMLSWRGVDSLVQQLSAKIVCNKVHER